MSGELDELLERYIEHRERHDQPLALDELCRLTPELKPKLEACLKHYEELEETLRFPARISQDQEPSLAPSRVEELPSFAGFRTVERLGAGGMGEVYKLEDLRLGRLVAAKVLRADGAGVPYADFLREARSLALFEDPGIVRIHELRTDAEKPVLIMEYIDGFELGRIAPGLELDQKVRILAQVCKTVSHAHALGIQHRDLKPGNILVDDRLCPKIVDFGLAGSNPRSGHGFGTLSYLAPEQLDPGKPIDERTDIYALGVVLYELISGELPFQGGQEEVLAAVLRGHPPLPKELDPAIPEPLQAIALKAMESDPQKRYRSALEMARDMDRYLGGRPVLARPTAYTVALHEKLRPHIAEIREWLTLKLIYPHEAERLREEYRRLDAREDDWIVASRDLKLSQIALYLGAFLLFLGSLFYVVAHEKGSGVAGPLLRLGLPFLALCTTAFLLELRSSKAVAVAFYMAGVTILPVFLVLFSSELGLWPGEGTENFFGDHVSNRELQISAFLSCMWAFALAVRTKTAALSAAFTALTAVLTLAIHTDLGLEEWLAFDEGEPRLDLLALHSAPLIAVLMLLGIAMERSRRTSFAASLYLGSTIFYVIGLELLAFDGRIFRYFHFSMGSYGWVKQSVDDLEAAATWLDMLTAMALLGMLVYATGLAIDRWGSVLFKRTSARLIFVLTPILILEPIALIVVRDDYANIFHWIFLLTALFITFHSHYRQRKTFYYAGLVNSGLAILMIGTRYELLEKSSFSQSILTAGLIALAAGFLCDHVEKTRLRKPD